MNILESSLMTNYVEELRQKFGWEAIADEVPYLYDSTILAITQFLGHNKSRDRKVALGIYDLEGEFKLAGIVQYHPNEDENEPGNWSYALTFDKEDIKDASITDSNDPQFQRIWNYSADNLHFLFMDNSMQIQTMIEVAAHTLKLWLDINAKEKEEVTLEMPGYFLATVVIEQGEKVMSITPDGAMKTLIKDDSALERTNIAS